MFAALLVLSALGADPGYATAYERAQTDGKPLCVLVSTDWCPGCITMKQRVIPRLLGKLFPNKAQYCSVNPERDPELAAKLMVGTSIPQMVVFNRTRTGWRRQQFVGALTQEQVEAIVDQSVAETPPLESP